jgi:ATP-binding protein involved in chromosome partitioning
LSHEMHVPFLGAIPIDIELRKSGDRGIPLLAGRPGSKAIKVFREIARKVVSCTRAVDK